MSRNFQLISPLNEITVLWIQVFRLKEVPKLCRVGMQAGPICRLSSENQDREWENRLWDRNFARKMSFFAKRTAVIIPFYTHHYTVWSPSLPWLMRPLNGFCHPLLCRERKVARDNTTAPWHKSFRRNFSLVSNLLWSRQLQSMLAKKKSNFSNLLCNS